MNIVDDVRQLVEHENARRDHRFIPGSVEEYVNKIVERAEFFFHMAAGRCDGFIAFYCNDPNKEKAFLTLILCAPQARGTRTADGLMASAIAVAQRRGFGFFELEVDTDNVPAIALYERHGFGVSVTRTGRHIMRKALR